MFLLRIFFNANSKLKSTKLRLTWTEMPIGHSSSTFIYKSFIREMSSHSSIVFSFIHCPRVGSREVELRGFGRDERWDPALSFIIQRPCYSSIDRSMHCRPRCRSIRRRSSPLLTALYVLLIMPSPLGALAFPIPRWTQFYIAAAAASLARFFPSESLDSAFCTARVFLSSFNAKTSESDELGILITWVMIWPSSVLYQAFVLALCAF